MKTTNPRLPNLKYGTAFIAALVISAAAVVTPFAHADAPAATPSSVTAPAAAAHDLSSSVPLPPPEAATKETVTNPYGLDALWKGGDFVARSTLIILVLMSIGSWYIIVTKLLEQVKLSRQAKSARQTFWQAGSVSAGIETLAPTSAYRYIAHKGNHASDHHDGALLEKIDLNTWVSLSIQRAVDKVKSRLTEGLAFLATVGSTAPFVGLFGTVWGIYHALTAIGIAGQASIDKVAGPVGEALIMTAIGLAVAVPAVLGYNWLVRRNKNVLDEIRDFSDELHSVLLSGVVPSDAGVKLPTKTDSKKPSANATEPRQQVA
jgi:biopolymer transport protein ExbB